MIGPDIEHKSWSHQQKKTRLEINGGGRPWVMINCKGHFQRMLNLAENRERSRLFHEIDLAHRIALLNIENGIITSLMT